MKKHFIKKTISFVLCASLVSGLIFVPGKASAADAVDTSGWRNTIALDFGVRSEGADLANDKTKFEEAGYTIGEVTEVLKEGNGNYLYEKTTINDIYGSEGAATQHIGFDKPVPAAKTTEGGNYFKDYVFSPDGGKYSFSADLPVGQYYVYIYTGNKTRDYGNTTVVNFNNEAVNEIPLNYDQTSADARQFYGTGANDNKENPSCIYIVDVKDNGSGYGTLTANFSDDKIGDENYSVSHQIKIGAALDEIAADVPDAEGNSPGKALGIQTFDFYEGTDAAIDSSALRDSLVTARLNGIEIVPVEQPNHAADVTAPENLVLDLGATASLAGEASDITDRVSYVSSNPEVASIDIYSGEVTANAVGEAELYTYNAYLEKFSVTKVSVIPERVVSLDKSDINFVLDGNGDKTAELTASFNAATEDIIKWSSSDENVVSIGDASFTAGDTATSKVTITAKGGGTADITATRGDNGKSVTCKVTVRVPVTGIQITDADNSPVESVTVDAGASTDVKVVIAPENATAKDVSFSSSDSGIAYATSNGDTVTITGVSAGEAVITLTSVDNPDISASIKVTVNKAPDTSSDNPNASGSPSTPGTTAGTQSPSATTPGGSSTTPGAANAAPQGGTDKQPAVSLSGKKSVSLKVKKSVTFKAKAPGSKVKKVTVKIKSGKKLIKVKKSGKKVKVTTVKKGTAKIVIKVKAASGASKKFTRTIKIK